MIAECAELGNTWRPRQDSRGERRCREHWTADKRHNLGNLADVRETVLALLRRLGKYVAVCQESAPALGCPDHVEWGQRVLVPTGVGQPVSRGVAPEDT
jgi:hypothetical protein